MASASTPPPMCQLCSHAVSSVHCSSCSLYLCTELGCDAELHRAAATSKHIRNPAQQQGSAAASTVSQSSLSTPAAPGGPGAPLCDLCEDLQSVVSCPDCKLSFCKECDLDMHSPPNKKTHVRVPIGDGNATAASPSPPTAVAAAATSAIPPKPSTAPAGASKPAAAAAPAEPCAVCDENDSTLSCAECDMELCQSCSADLHKPAKMANHKITPLGAVDPTPAKPSTAPSQPAKPTASLNPSTPSAIATTQPNTPAASPSPTAPLCEICEEEPAIVACPECKSRFCAGCDADIHKPAKMAGHKRNPLSNVSRPSTASAPVLQPTKPLAPSPSPPPASSAADLLCAMCDENPPEVHCAECKMDLCIKGGCDADMHVSGKTMQHKRVKIGEKAQGSVTPSPQPATSLGGAAALLKPQAIAAPAAAATATPVAECEVCEAKPGPVSCDACAMSNLCDDCDRDLHKPAKMQSHQRKRAGGQEPTVASHPPAAAAVAPTPAAAATAPAAAIEECEVCESKPGPISCDACAMSNLCEDCDRDLHKPVKMQSHQRTRADGKSMESAKPNPSPSPPPPAAASSTPKPTTPTPAPPAASASGKTEPCEVCEEVDSTFHCVDCAMDLCSGCNTDLHKPAKMQSHKVTPIGGGAAVNPTTPTPAPSQSPPPLAAASTTECQVCEDAPATISCQDCNFALCSDCNRDLHKPAKMVSHRRSPLGAPKPSTPAVTAPAAGQVAKASSATCVMCDEQPSEVHCPECKMDLCIKSGCDADMHRSGKTATHKRYKFGEVMSGAPAANASPPPSAAAVAKPLAANGALNALKATIHPPAVAAECEVCEENPAEVRCADCKMNICIKGGCDKDLHKPGTKNAAHRRAPINGASTPAPSTPAASPSPPPTAAAVASSSSSSGPAPTCDVCDENASEVHCAECKMNLCIKGGCDKDLHKPGTKNAAHKRTPLGGASTPAPSTRAASPAPPAAASSAALSGPAPTCEVCDENVSEVQCVECKMDLCIKGGCDTDLHKPGSKNASHHRNKYGAPAAAASNGTPTPAAAASPASVQDCEVCEAKPGPISCESCDMSNLCEDCDRDLHKPVKTQSHQRTRADGKAIESARPSPTPSPPPAAAATPKPATPVVASKSPSPTPSPPPAVVAPPEGDEEGLCAMCEENPAEVQCDQCKMKLCLIGGCDADMHRMAKNAGHKRTKIVGPAPKEGISGVASPRSLPQGQKCELCDEATPVAFCEECKMYLCKANGCDDDVHKPEKMKNHHRVAIFGASAPVHPPATPVKEGTSPVPTSPSVVVDEEAKESPMSPTQMSSTGPFTVQLSTPSGSKIVVAGGSGATASSSSPAKPSVIIEEKKQDSKQPKSPGAKPKVAQEKKSPTSPKNAPKSPKSPKAVVAAEKKQPSPKVGARSITSEPLIPIGPVGGSSNALPGDASELRKMVEELQKRLAQVEAEVQSPKSAGGERERRRKKSKSREHRSKRHASSQPREQADEQKADQHRVEPSKVAVNHLGVPEVASKEQEEEEAAEVAADEKQRERSPRKHRSRKHRSSRSPHKQRKAAPEKPVIPAPLTPPQEPLSPPQRRLAQLEELIEHQLAAREEEEEALEQARIEEEKAERAARHERREARRRKRRERQEREAAQALDRVRAREQRAEEEESRRFNQAREKKHDREEEKDYPSPHSPRKSPRRGQYRARQEEQDGFHSDEQDQREGGGEEDESRVLDKFEDADEPSLVAELFGDPSLPAKPSSRKMEAELAKRGDVASVGGAASSSRSRAARIRDRLLAASQLSDAATSATLHNHHATHPAPPLEQLPPEFSHFSADYPGSSRNKPESHMYDLPSHDARSHSAELIARFRREARLELESRRNAQLSHIWAAGQASVDAHTGYNQMLFHPPPIPPPLFDFSAVNPHEFASSFAAMKGINSESSSNSTSRDVSPSHGRSKHIYSFMPIGGNGGSNAAFSASQPLSNAHNVVLDNTNPFATARPHSSHGPVPQPMPPARTQPASRPMSARGDGGSTSRRRAQLAATARPATTGHFSTSTAASNAHRSPSPPVASRHRAAPPVPTRTFYRPDVKDGPTPSERLVSEIVNHPNAAVWRQSNLRTIFGLQQVRKIQSVAKVTMDDKTNPYLR